MDAFMPIDKGNIMLVLLSLTTTSSAIEWFIATMIVEWWATHGVTPDNEEVIDHSLVWHDLWAHAAHGFGVDATDLC